MMFRIDRNTKLKDIQKGFTGMFTFLKLEFLKIPHKTHQYSTKKSIRSPEEVALPIDKRHTVVEIELDNSLKVHEVEDIFFCKADLCVQVFRKSGNVWIETFLTDDWTLEQQNKEGELLSTFFITNPDKVNNGPDN